VTTIGVDFRFRTLQINKSTVRLQIWDTAGQERYRTITKAYYKGADGILVTFDLTDKESFLNIDGWMKEVEKQCGPEVNIIVLANKSDVGDP
jgi:small GTP-binding protein